MARLRESSYFRKSISKNGSSLCRSGKKKRAPAVLQTPAPKISRSPPPQCGTSCRRGAYSKAPPPAARTFPKSTRRRVASMPPHIFRRHIRPVFPNDLFCHWCFLLVKNKHPPAEPVVFQFRAVSPNTTSGAQAALMTTWQSCDCYLLPVNGPFLCLTFFSYAFAPLFLFLIFIFPFTFLSLLFLLFLLFLPYFLLPFLLLFFVHRQSLS